MPSEGADAEATSVDQAPAPHAAEPAQHAPSPMAHLHRTLKGAGSISKEATNHHATRHKQAVLQRKLLVGKRAGRGRSRAVGKFGHQQEPAEGAAGPSSSGPQLPSSDASVLDGTQYLSLGC